VQLVELGPGRGTLMQDALRIGRLEPAWLAAIRLHLVEINPKLRAMQAERLSPYGPHWHKTLDTVPDGPTMLVANEFFDALPIRQLVFARGDWRERLVSWDPGRGFHFTVAAAPSPHGVLVPQSLSDAAEGSVFELSPASIGVVNEIGSRIARFGGAALLIDYGRSEPLTGDTLQAVRRHRKVGALDDPGGADLSAHVDFDALRRAAREAGAATFGPVPQRDFLGAIGIETRARMLRRNAAEAGRIEEAVERLIGPDAMGALFKALAIMPPGTPPAGFSAED
jgi:NADH dehydrogenase [ubiquinone] 1 alpha subcomplex assembly factor 7